MAFSTNNPTSAYKTPAATSHTMSMTVAAGSTGLICFVRCYEGDLVTAVSFNTSETLVQQDKQKEGASIDRWYAYYLANPTATTANIALTLSANGRVQILAFATTSPSSTGNPEVVPAGNNGTATTASFTQTSVTNGSFHIVGLTADLAITPTVNWTNIVTEASNGVSAVGYYEAATAGAVTQTATFGLSQFAINGFVLKPSGGASTPSRLMMLGVG